MCDKTCSSCETINDSIVNRIEADLEDIINEIEEDQNVGIKGNEDVLCLAKDSLLIARDLKMLQTPKCGISYTNTTAVDTKGLADKDREHADILNEMQDVIDEIESELDETKTLNEALLTLVKALLKDQDE